MEVWRDVTSIINAKSMKKMTFVLFFVTVLSILFSTVYAQDDIYPRIISQTPEASTRPHWAGSYLIAGSNSETFSVTYNETNMTKVMLFWKDYGNEKYNNITLSGCNSGEYETCSVDLDLSTYPNETVIVYDFVVYDSNSCSLDPWLAEYEEQCGNSTGLPKNCLKEFQSPDNVTIEICVYDMYGYPIIQGSLSVPPDTDLLRHVTIDRTPPPTTTTTSSTTTTTTTTITTTSISLEERVKNLEERVSFLETLINLLKKAVCSLYPFENFDFCLGVPPFITTTTTIPTITTTAPTMPTSWDHSTCYSKCLKGTDVPYDPCHGYWAVTNLVDRGYCNFL